MRTTTSSRWTLDAYGLRPPVEDFRGHPAAAPGMTSSLFPWHPRFAEAEVKNPDGSFRQRNEVELTEEPYDGVTDAATGRMYIHRSGFVSDHSTLFRGTPKWNPDALASILVHESAHWVYVMMHAGGHANDASVRLQSEEFALTHQADFFEHVLLDAAGATALREAAARAGVRSALALKHHTTVEEAKAYGWLHGVSGFGHSARTQGELEAVPPISDEEFAASLERIHAEAAQRAAALNHGLQRAGPTAPSASEPLYARAGPAAPSAHTPPTLTAPRRTADHEIIAMVSAACREDWAAAGSFISSYTEIWEAHIRALEDSASVRPDGCERSLLYRVAAMRRAGEALDLPRLQLETANSTLPPALDAGPHERERPGDGRPRGGVNPGDRPSQRQAERILRGGTRFP